MLISKLLIEEGDKYIDFLGNNPTIVKANELIQNNIENINSKRKEYKEKISFTFEEYCNKFDIDLRKAIKI